MGLAIIVEIITMASNGKPQLLRQIFSQQPKGGVAETLDAAVRQDKARIASARTATPQPAAVQTPLRAKGLNRNTPRSTNGNNAKTTTVHLDLWVSPIVKAELQRLAQQETHTPHGSRYLLKEVPWQ
jgi:hypothetical protein